MSTSAQHLEHVLREARACRHCAAKLAHPPRPVVRARVSARILVIGQAPGTRVHQSGLPFDDPSGDRLRSWLAVTRDEFYDERAFAFLPMGLCYPGRATNGADLPPRPECAPLWQLRVIEALPNVQLTLLVGQYALRHHLGNAWPGSVRTAVAAWRSAPTNVWPLPHPSWRVNGWLKQNPWFEREVLPALRTRVRDVVEKQ